MTNTIPKKSYYKPRAQMSPDELSDAREKANSRRSRNRDKININAKIRYYAKGEKELTRKRKNTHNRDEKRREWQVSDAGRACAKKSRLKREATNPGDTYRRTKQWREQNPGKAYAHIHKRRVAKISACPAWVSQDEIANIFALAMKLTSETGVQHSVDHIVPLINKVVCGLHAPINLRVITRRENTEKNNKFLQNMAIAPTKANGLLKSS